MKKVNGFSPYRISFFGGGTDIEPYPSDFGGYCLSSTINLGCYAELTLRDDKVRKIVSLNKGKENFFFIKNLKKILNHQYNSGFIFKYYNDLPTGSGLGTSGAIIGLLSKFENLLKKQKLSKYQEANRAYFLEKKIVGTSGGRQDEYASIFGGLNFMKFEKDKTEIKKLKPKKNFIFELQKRSLLVFSGLRRDGSKVIKKHIKNLKTNNKINLLHKNKELTFRMKKIVEKGDYNLFIKKINEYWELKKKFNKDVTNQKIENIVHSARKKGAISAKITGAGNGGHILFFVEIENKDKLRDFLEKKGMVVRNFIYSNNGSFVKNN